jgi:hypothetical protein
MVGALAGYVAVIHGCVLWRRALAGEKTHDWQYLEFEHPDPTLVAIALVPWFPFYQPGAEVAI